MSLKYLFDQPTLNVRQDRWLEFPCDFNFEIKHVNGKENKFVDALSKKFHVVSLSGCKSDLSIRNKLYNLMRTRHCSCFWGGQFK